MPDQGDSEEEITYHILTQIPPGGGSKQNLETGERTLSAQLWQWWLQEASRYETPDAVLDAVSGAIRATWRGEEGMSVPDVMPGADNGNKEHFAAMVAVVASAMAIDGFYGCIKPLVNVGPPSKKPPARERQILEVLKLGSMSASTLRLGLRISIGCLKPGTALLIMAPRTANPIIHRITERKTVVLGAPDTYGVIAASAQRAAKIAETVIETCTAAPKPATKRWVDWCT